MNQVDISKHFLKVTKKLYLFAIDIQANILNIKNVLRKYLEYGNL